MYKPSYVLLTCFWIVSATAADMSSVTAPEASAVAIGNASDSKPVPKLKADVDAYGEFGWQYVQMNYKTYKWKRNIDKLDDEQKHQLTRLIRSAQQAQ